MTERIPASRQRAYLNLNAAAWRQVRRAWKLPASFALYWQSLVAGSVFTGLDRLQEMVVRRRTDHPSLRGSVVVLGYWRSGTTLLHQYLSRDGRYGFPTTYACMNPQHFLLTESRAKAHGGRGVRRPMDDMMVFSDSPQEDEFALLALGARSPYEALLAPANLDRCLSLANPDSLTPSEKQRWREIFIKFLTAVCLSQGGRPLILKSPPHGYRIAILRELLPDARFILLVRDPLAVFESAVRMWCRLFDRYAMTEPPPEDDIRCAVLADRLRFEAHLAAGIAALPRNRFALLRYETLVSRPIETIGALYNDLELGDFGDVSDAMAAESLAVRDYKPMASMPAEPWLTRVTTSWRDVIDRYGYSGMPAMKT
jgi:omega-hydroxy-beta-dihydromenaquinone-9 sulfotransferase